MAEKEKEIALEEEIKADNVVVTGWLLYCKERKREYEQKKEMIINSSFSDRFSEVPGKAYISDSTARKAVKLAELEKTEKWIELIEEVERRLPWKMQLILRLRRESKYSRRFKGYWRVYVHMKYVEKIAAILNKNGEDVWVSEETIRRFWDKIVNYTARLAGKRGLL